MIARHSHEQSADGEGVEVVENCECEDPEHGKGRFTEKRIHLSRFFHNNQFSKRNIQKKYFKIQKSLINLL